MTDPQEPEGTASQRPPGADPPPEPDESPPADESPPQDETAASAGSSAGRGRLRRLGALVSPFRLLDRWLPPWQSGRGILIRFVLAVGFGGIVTLGMISTMHYTETASFCGRCHTMGPELKAHQLSPHRELACAECHVKPGLGGFLQAKINGTKQLVQVLTGTFPRPIPPPDHSELPPVADTCLRCHSVGDITRNGGPVELVLRPQYQPDEKNTRQLVALVIRPFGLGGANVEGVHWHIQQQVTYTSTDPATQKITLVEIKRPDGSVVDYIAADQVGVSVDAKADVARLSAAGRNRVMDCIDCHNRIGHEAPSIDQAVNDALSSGRISSSLPYIKKQAVALLSANYPSLSAADAAMDGLMAGYRGQYPLVLRQQEGQIARSIATLKQIYRELATPDMKVQAQTYPDNLGHQTSAGCFRCHDGAHYQVINGKLSTKAIPSSCATCHTFPQISNGVPSIVLAGQPASHTDKLYVFTHKNLVSSLDPGGTACGACHTKSYCLNCHNTGAGKVDHDEMLYRHADSIRKVGGTACAFCHQPAYCARCHGNTPVLQTPPGKLQ